MPTFNGYRTIIAIAAAVASGRIFGVFELYIAAAILVVALGLSLVWTWVNRRRIIVTRDLTPNQLHVGTNADVALNFATKSRFQTPVLHSIDKIEGASCFDESIPPFNRNKPQLGRYGFLAERRGYVSFGPLTTQFNDPFGLAYSKRKHKHQEKVLVYPKIDHVQAPPPPGGDLAPQPDRKPGRIGASGDEFSALRSYVIGDDLRKVHWASSARLGELLVRSEHIPEHGHASLLLDNRISQASAEVFEKMVSAAASILSACHTRGDFITFESTGGDSLRIQDAKSYRKALELLALIEQVDTETPSYSTGTKRSGSDTSVILCGDKPLALAPDVLEKQNHRSAIVCSFGSNNSTNAPTAGVSARFKNTPIITIAANEDFAKCWRRGLRASKPKSMQKVEL